MQLQKKVLSFSHPFEVHFKYAKSKKTPKLTRNTQVNRSLPRENW